jgi:molecular chaperone DnaK (HSP70)
MSSSSLPSTSTVAVGVDLGSFNARVATYDANLKHPVVSANHDGHRTTKVIMEGNEPVTAESLPTFYQQRPLQLASDAAHTKDLAVVTGIPNGTVDDDWIDVLTTFGGVITEAAAVCLAYGVESVDSKKVLVIDGGASGVKATVLSSKSGLWVQEHYSKLESVNGTTLVEPLAQSVAQQFEQKHRFPRGEVWQSKKAKAKLVKECEESLSTLQRQTNVTIHIDGLYEGMDCQVLMSKPKWEHLSSKLANQVKTFLKELPEVEAVLLSGNLHSWLQPMVKSVVGDKLQSTSLIDPSEAVALGCTLQAYLNMQQQREQEERSEDEITCTPTMQVSTSPVSIGIGKSPSVTLIDKGTPLPCLATHECSGSESCLELWQFEPTQKAIAKLEDLEASSTVKLQLNAEGQLRIWVNGQSLVVG